jgi:phage repressor protein C with HTH and peptisase S24 domain
MGERVIDRALRMAAERGWDQSEFARQIGEVPQAITNWKARGMPAGKQGKVASALGCSVDALLGREAGESGPRLGPTMAPILAWDHEEDLPEGEFIFIPRLEVHLSAGLGKDQVEFQFVEKQPQAFRADWVRRERLKPKKLAAMYATGRSMEPSIWDGDSLVVDTSQTEVTDGKVYALWYEGGERVKRLFRIPGGGLRIQSDNPEFPPIILEPGNLTEIRIIGRVVHRAGKGGL